MSDNKGVNDDTLGDLYSRIEADRAALHAAIRRAEDRPLSLCPEVLRLSGRLDALINQAQWRERERL
jgi:hypothetical protein